METENFNITGSCLCENHSFSIDVRKVRFGFASCHCTICRKSHGAPFVMWAGMNKDNSTPDVFQVVAKEGAAPLSKYASTPTCDRYFCPSCGTNLYLKYGDGDGETERWAGEVHFPTALLNDVSCGKLEVAMRNANRPRYLHVFASTRHPCMGDWTEWASAPKYGGETGLEPLDS